MRARRKRGEKGAGNNEGRERGTRREVSADRRYGRLMGCIVVGVVRGGFTTGDRQ